MAEVDRKLKKMDENYVVDARMIIRLPAEIGRYLMENNLQKSLKYLDEGMLALPDERYCILNRAIARKRAFNIRGALDDVNAAFRLDPNDLRTHAINNDILYMKKQFENALIVNSIFLKQRRHPDDFYLGKMKCLDTIKNCTYIEHCGHPLRDHFKIIRQQAWERNTSQKEKLKSKHYRKKVSSFPSTIEVSEQSREKATNLERNPERKLSSSGEQSELLSISGSSQGSSKCSVSRVEMLRDVVSKEMAPPLKNHPYRPLQRRTSNLEKFLSEKYLDKLYMDRIFLKRVQTRRGFEGANKVHEEKLKELVEKGQKDLWNLQEFLRSCKPVYYFKYQEKKYASCAEARRRFLVTRRRKETNKIFDNLYQRLRLAYNTRNLRTLITSIESLVEHYEHLPNIYIQEHQNDIIESFKLLRDGYYYFGMFSPGMSKEDKINRIKVRLGLQLEKRPSNDSLYRNLKEYHPIDWRTKIKATEERLKNARFQEEIIYFQYELSRFYVELRKMDYAYSFGKKCIKTAREMKEMRWVINVLLLLAKSCVYSSNQIDTLKILDRAVFISKTMDCADLIEFVTLAVKVVRKTDFTPGFYTREAMLKRQKQILYLLKDSESNRMKAEHLFQKLSVTPARRTMSLIPGLTLVDEIKAEKSSRKKTKSAKRFQKDISQRKRGMEFYDYVEDYLVHEN